MLEIEPPGFAPHGGGGGGGGGVACVASPGNIFESEERRREKDEAEECVSPPARSSTTEETSSIGKNSDVSEAEGEEKGEESEVQSAYKGTLDSMDSLEEVLPIRRGISSFYNGKSKSFTSLAEASSSTSSIKDIAKPENAYTRRRRNLLAFNHVWDRNKGFPHRSSSLGGGISKRPSMSSSKSMLALAVAMSSSESISSSSDDSISVKSPPRHLPPLHPRSRASHTNLASLPLSSSPQQDLSPWRSFSVVDLQQCAIAAANNTTISTNTTNYFQ